MPTAQVFSFFRQPAPRDWSPQDIAEFYRVELVLIQAGLRITSARGLSDEGDPWFVFCRAEDDEVIVHFARIDGSYVISSPAYCNNAVGRDFRSLVRGLIESHPMLQLRPRGDNLFLHPSALLVVLVATALFKLSPAAAATPAAPDGADTAAVRLRGGGLAVVPVPGLAPLSEMEQGTLILAAINGALTLTVVAGPVTSVVSAAAHVPDAAGPLHVTVVDTAPAELFHSTLTIGTGSVTPLALQHELAAVMMPVDLTNQPLTFAALPADAATGVGPVTSSLPQLPLVAIDPEIGVTYVSLSGLPNISAADKALLQTLGLTGNVTYLSELPPVFSNAVKTGSHTAVHAATADVSHAVADTSHAVAETSPVATDNVTTPVPSVAPEFAATETTVTAPSSTPVTAPVAALPDMAAVIAAVVQFQAVEIHPVVLITAHAAIFYDAAAFATQPNAIQSVNYDFGDGFTISLVGLPAELAHAVVHV